MHRTHAPHEVDRLLPRGMQPGQAQQVAREGVGPEREVVEQRVLRNVVGVPVRLLVVLFLLLLLLLLSSLLLWLLLLLLLRFQNTTNSQQQQQQQQQ